MAHIQLASSVAYIGELGETCGYGRLVDVDSLEFFSFLGVFKSFFFFFVSKKVYNKLYVLVKLYVMIAIVPQMSYC